MLSQDESQENVAWPSYVDFLSTFIFILIIFLGSLLYLMVQGIRQGQFIQDSSRSVPVLISEGFKPIKGRLQLTVPLNGRLQFAKGCPGKIGCSAGLDESEKVALRNLADVVGTQHARCTRIVVRGQADSDKYVNPVTKEVDPLGNYDLSNRRASLVLRYLLLECNDCSDAFKGLRSKLTLAGVGDTLASKSSPARDDDRTVNIIIDYSGNVQ